MRSCVLWRARRCEHRSRRCFPVRAGEYRNGTRKYNALENEPGVIREDYTLAVLMMKLGHETPLFRYSSASTVERQRWCADLAAVCCTNNAQELFEMVTFALREGVPPL
jgi:hypothetical protein